MRTFLRDRNNQIVLGLFVATFLYTLVVLRDVRSAQSGIEFVPGLSVFVAFLLLIACVAAFIYYINHMAHSISATAVIESIAIETSQAIDRLFPEKEPDLRAPQPIATAYDEVVGTTTVSASAAGNLVTLDHAGLVGQLREADTFAGLAPLIGDFVPEGAPLFYVNGEVDENLATRLRGGLTLASERTLQQDAAFGLRQIVDVGYQSAVAGHERPDDRRSGHRPSA